MNSVNKLIEKVDILNNKVDLLNDSQAEFGSKVLEILSRIEAQSFELQQQRGEDKKNAGYLRIPNTFANTLVKKTILSDQEWLDEATLHSYQNDLNTFKKNSDIFVRIMEIRNMGYSMDEIFETNASRMPRSSISGIYNCINAARREGYVSIENNRYEVCAFKIGSES